MAAQEAFPPADQDNDVLGFLAIERSSTSEQVAAALRTKITGGELGPGTPLPEIVLADSLGVSRNTIREALRILTREGLVSHHMHRGATVAVLSEEDVADIFRVRRTLETAGVEASRHVDPERLQPLRGAVESIARAAAAEESSRVVESDVEFHRRLVGLLESPRLNRFFEELQGELWLCLALGRADEPDPLLGEHAELCELMENGEQDRCRAKLQRHLAISEENLKSIARSMADNTKARRDQ
jgi:DNA-binding GntR family transcriptional regulator